MFKSATSVHAEPFHDSVFPELVGGRPLLIIAAVVVPQPETLYRPVFISVISVHEVPLYCSTRVEAPSEGAF